MKTLKECNKEKLYTAGQLMNKYEGKYIDTYPQHHTFWNTAQHQFETVYEVRGVSKTERENYQTPEEAVNPFNVSPFNN